MLPNSALMIDRVITSDFHKPMIFIGNRPDMPTVDLFDGQMASLPTGDTLQSGCHEDALDLAGRLRNQRSNRQALVPRLNTEDNMFMIDQVVRFINTMASDRRCTLARCVARRLNKPGILVSRAWYVRRLRELDASPYLRTGPLRLKGGRLI